MQFVANVAIPVLVFFVMTVVGLELTPADFRRVLHYPAQVATVIGVQAVLLPLVGWLVIQLVGADARVAVGLMLIAASPIAASTNYYALLARADVALAVTLTAVSSVVALVATPLAAAAALEWLLREQSDVQLPIVLAARQILLGMVVPVGVGMLVRHMAPDWSARHRQRLQYVSLLVLLGVILFVLADQTAVVAAGLMRLMVATLLFTVATAAAGYALAIALWSDRAARVSVALGFCDRNLSAAVMLAATVLGRMDFVAFATVFLLVQAALLLPVLLWVRRQGNLTVKPT